MAKIRGLRWWMIGLNMLGSIINYLTRSTLAVAAPTLLIGYAPFFICLGLLDVVGAVILWTMVKVDVTVEV